MGRKRGDFLRQIGDFVDSAVAMQRFIALRAF